MVREGVVRCVKQSEGIIVDMSLQYFRNTTERWLWHIKHSLRSGHRFTHAHTCTLTHTFRDTHTQTCTRTHTNTCMHALQGHIYTPSHSTPIPLSPWSISFTETHQLPSDPDWCFFLQHDLITVFVHQLFIVLVQKRAFYFHDERLNENHLKRQ